MTEPIPARVARGAALLDERLPGWVDRIDLDRLDLESPCNCILGQTWEGEAGEGEEYWLHAGRLFPGEDRDIFADPADYGFNSRAGGSGEYEALTAAWRELILARRAGAPS